MYNRFEFDERLDEQLDSGSIQVISDQATAFEDYSLYQVTIRDGTDYRSDFYYGIDTVEKRGAGYYVHTIELIELTRLLMGLPIEGRKVTQPIEGDKKTLYTVLDELLTVAETVESAEKRRYNIADGVKGMLEAVTSPEFHWEGGTLLWECLCDIGNVMNCIPRLIYEPGNGLFITFDEVNKITGVWDLSK